jgi:large subunit ribosomal protein L4
MPQPTLPLAFPFARPNVAGYRDLRTTDKTVPVLTFATAAPTGAQLQLDEHVFGTELRTDIVHRVVVWQQKNSRTTLYKAKNRAEVRGGGRKPWKQKGTGRARQGSIRSPIWVKGGKAHPAKLRDWSVELPKKMRALGLRVALAAKFADRRLTVVDSLVVAEGKTRALEAALEAHGLAGKPVVFIGSTVSAEFGRAVSNIPRCKPLPAAAANVYDLVRADSLVITPDALAELSKRLA